MLLNLYFTLIATMFWLFLLPFAIAFLAGIAVSGVTNASQPTNNNQA